MDLLTHVADGCILRCDTHFNREIRNVCGFNITNLRSLPSGYKPNDLSGRSDIYIYYYIYIGSFYRNL